MRHSPSPLLIRLMAWLPVLLSTLTACSMQSRQSYSPSSPQTELVRARDWDFMTMVIKGARTQLENNGHFRTVPNACYRRENGALELELWNRVATAVNRLLEQQWLDEPVCEARPAGAADIYQPVVLHLLNQEQIEILTPNGSRFCTRSVDVETASTLLVALAEVGKRASLEGCPPRSTSLWQGVRSPLDADHDWPGDGRDDNDDDDHGDDHDHSRDDERNDERNDDEDRDQDWREGRPSTPHQKGQQKGHQRDW